MLYGMKPGGMKAGYAGQLNLWRRDQGARLRVFALWFPVLISRAMANLNSLLNQLQKERSRLASQLGRLNNAISALNGVSKVICFLRFAALRSFHVTRYRTVISCRG